MEYITFKPTQEMLDDLEKQYLYRNGLDLNQDICREKMFLIHLSHQAIPKDREEFYSHYNAYLYELEVLYKLIETREYGYFKGIIKDYLKGTKSEYDVYLPYNEYIGIETDIEEEKLSVKDYLFEQVMIQDLRGSIDYNEEHEDWMDRYNSFAENIEYAIEKYIHLVHYELYTTYKEYILKENEKDNTDEG